jgi:hypothetical protein
MSSSSVQVKILHQVMVFQGDTIGIVLTLHSCKSIHRHRVKFLVAFAFYNIVIRIVACRLVSNKSDGDLTELIFLLKYGVESFTAP